MIIVEERARMKGCHVNEFYEKLLGFRAIMGQESSQWPPLDGKMTRQELQWFLTRPANAGMIETGFQQISDFRETLIRCVWGVDD